MARRIKTLTPERIADLPDLCSSCGFWDSEDARVPECGTVDEPRRFAEWVENVREGWGECGRIAYADGECIGFARYAPARFLPQVRRMPAGLPSDDAVLLACLHVVSDVRHVGVGKVLLQAAMRDLSVRGEHALEAYAAADTSDRLIGPMVTIDCLVKQGFTVLRPHPRYPLMRLELKGLAGWTENVEALLESLHLPLLGRERIPSPLAGR